VIGWGTGGGDGVKFRARGVEAPSMRQPRSAIEALATHRSADRRALTADGLRPMSLAACLLFCLLAPVHLADSPGRSGVIMATVTGALAVAFGLVRVAAKVPAVCALMERHAHEMAFLFCLVGSIDAFVSLAVSGQPWQSGSVMLNIVMIGYLLHSPRYASVLVLLSLAVWVAVAARHGFSGTWHDLAPVLGAAALLSGVLSAARCRTADRLVAARAAAAEIALTDQLTGLANRRGFLVAGHALVERARSLHRPMSLLFVDIDGLKQANDTGGHTRGDRLIRDTAGALRSIVGASDAVGRLGGDEFTILLHDVGPEQVASLQQRLQQALQDRGVAASIGHADLDLADPHQTLEHLIDDGDAAMYAVKQRARSKRLGNPLPGGRRLQAWEVAALEGSPDAADADAADAGDAGDAAPATRGRAHATLADLQVIAPGGTLIFAALVPVQLLLGGAAAHLLAGTLVAAAAIFGSVWILLRRTTSLPRRHSSAVLVSLAIVMVAVALIHVQLTQQAWAATLVMLAVLATAALVHPPRLAVPVMVLAVLAGSVLLAGNHRGDAQWAGYRGQLVGALAVGIFLQVTQARTLARLIAARASARAMAATDELTGVCNRRGFLAAGAPRVDLTRRAGGGASVIYLDLDGLKRVNDARGHSAGDLLLVTTARVLRAVARPCDIPAGLGGDEFALLLPRAQPLEMASVVTDLRAGLADEGVEASIGTGYLEGESITLERLLNLADASMYRAKLSPSSAAARAPAPARVPPSPRPAPLRPVLSAGASPADPAP